MAYRVYLGNMLLPVTPQKISMSINGQNKTYKLIDGSEVNILNKAGLTDIKLDALLPQARYPFSSYKSGFVPPAYFTGQLEKYIVSEKPFQFIVTRTLPNGKLLFDTNVTVSLQDYEVKEDSKQGFDLIASIKLKQYKNFGVKKCTFVSGWPTPKVVVEEARQTDRYPVAATTYTVKQDGETLWEVARRVYGDGSMYGILYSANSEVLVEPNMLTKGTLLRIPV